MIDQKEGETELRVKIHYDEMVSRNKWGGSYKILLLI